MVEVGSTVAAHSREFCEVQVTRETRSGKREEQQGGKERKEENEKSKKDGG